MLLLLLPMAAGAATVHEHTLGNGLKVIVKEDHRAPVVVSQVWYKVGSSYEHGGLTGISHALEHMMFQGTKNHPPGEFSRIIAAQGGSENAFTTRDYTAYYEQLEKSRLPVAFRLEADRMRNLSLKQSEFGKEMQVVMEERRMRTEDKPRSRTYEQFMAAAYEAAPYHHPVIGWMGDIAHLTVGDLRRWYQKWYAPNNAILVVVGDVEPQQVFKLAERYFGGLAPSHITPPKPRHEPEQDGERVVRVSAPAELPYLVMGYKAPVLLTGEPQWKSYAMEVLAGVLDGGDSARFARELVRGKAIAASASAGYSPYDRFRGLLTLSGVPARGHTIPELEKAFRAQVAALRDKPVAADELARIKAQVVAAKVFQRDSMFSQATQIGSLEALGLGWKTGEEYVERIRAVTPEQVQQVAREYLKDSALTVAILDPQPVKGRRVHNENGASDVVR